MAVYLHLPDRRRVALTDGQWEESKHPRADNGQFGSGGGGAKSEASKAVRGTSELSKDQQEAVQDYISGQYEMINAELRNNKGNWRAMNPDSVKVVQQLDKALLESKTKGPTELYRGAALTAAQVKDLKVGASLINHGYTSTTTDLKIAERFSGEDERAMGPTTPVVFTYKMPAGTQALDLNDIGSAEAEVLLKRSLLVRVVSVKKVGKTIQVVAQGF